MKKKYFRDIVDHPDFFIIDISDLSIKDDQLTMEHPFFSLKKGKDLDSREFVLKDGSILTISPNNMYGLATVHDKDIWIYFLSRAVYEYNQTGEVPRRVTFNSYDCLKTIKRPSGGSSYERLRDAVRRLSGTLITSDLESKEKKRFSTYHLIDSASFVENSKGTVVAGYVDLPDWVIRNIKSKKIKTINPDYFLLKRPIDKRLYEIASKHVGNGISWPFTLSELKVKCGSTSSLREFRRQIKDSSENTLFPDYFIEYDKEKDLVKFINKNPKLNLVRNHISRDELPIVSNETIQYINKQAKKISNPNLLKLENPALTACATWLEIWKLSGRKPIQDVEKEYRIFAINFLKEYDGQPLIMGGLNQLNLL